MSDSGRANSIIGNISMREMGVRAHSVKKSRTTPHSQAGPKGGTILENATLHYHPKTEIQRQYYAHLLQYIVKNVGDLPSSDLHELAYNMIHHTDDTLKEIFKDVEKHKSIVLQMISYLGTSESAQLEENVNVDFEEMEEMEVVEEDHIEDLEIIDLLGELDSKLSIFDTNVKIEILELIKKSENPMSLENHLIKIFNYEKNDIIMFILENLSQIQDRLANLHVKPRNISEIIPTKYLDFNDFIFKDRGHFQANKNCKLPQGSYKKQKQGYEEIHIPMKEHERENIHHIPIVDLPIWAQPCFPSMTHLNTIQTLTFDSSFKSSGNMLVAAPTGSGKTNISLLAMLELVQRYTINGEILKDEFKIVYVAPLKALVQELVHTFGVKLSPLGLTVNELTGDSAMSKLEILNTNVIITTPEKWDIITRKGMEAEHIDMVKLLIVDEIHLLHDIRGSVLETIIARSLSYSIRIIGLSATLPNYMDVSAFLRCSEKDTFYFDSSYRPCPLQQEFIGITLKKFKRLELMNEIVYEKVMEDAGEYQVIIFVHSRKETWKTAETLLEYAIERNTLGKLFTGAENSRNVLESVVGECDNPHLKKILGAGFAIHHAGLTKSDRTLVEDLFADKHIQVLVATSTLAVGINLPSHTCIIKGTKVYNPERGQFEEIGHEACLQMIGRAGRPGFDVFGRGVVITEYHELPYYLCILNSQFPIESQLFAKIVDVINSEIVLGNIRNLVEGAEYLLRTYLFVRMIKSPHVYHIPLEELEQDPTLMQRRINIIHSVFINLEKSGMAFYKSPHIVSTDLGKIASYYYLPFDSLITYYQFLKPHFNMVDLFRIFSMSQEFRFIPVREEEKIELQRLLDLVPIPVREGFDSNLCKVNLLLQSYITNNALDGFALSSDLIFISQSASRIFRALADICSYFKWFMPYKCCLDIAKMIDKKIWPINVLQQIPYIPSLTMTKLQKKNISFQRLQRFKVEQLAEVLGSLNDAKIVYSGIRKIPNFEIVCHLKPLTPQWFKLIIEIEPLFDYDADVHHYREFYNLVVTDAIGMNIICSKQVKLRNSHTVEELQFKCKELPKYFLFHIHSLRFISQINPVSIPTNIRVSDKMDEAQDDLVDIEQSELQSNYLDYLSSHYKLSSLHDQLDFLIRQESNSIFALHPKYFSFIIDSIILNDIETYSNIKILIVSPTNTRQLKARLDYLSKCISRANLQLDVMIKTVEEAQRLLNFSVVKFTSIISLNVQNLRPEYETFLIKCQNYTKKLKCLSEPIPNYRDFCHLLDCDPKLSMSLSLHFHNPLNLHFRQQTNIKHISSGLVITKEVEVVVRSFLKTATHSKIFTSNLLNAAFDNKVLFLSPNLTTEDVEAVLNLVSSKFNVVVHPLFIYHFFAQFSSVSIFVDGFTQLTRAASFATHEVIIQHSDKDFVKKVLMENGFPVESRLHTNIEQLLMQYSEIEIPFLLGELSKSFLFSRCRRNPQYYTSEDINVFFSELVEQGQSELSQMYLLNSKWTPLYTIAHHYDITHTNIDIINLNIKRDTKRSTLLEILSHLQLGSVPDQIREYYQHENKLFALITCYLQRIKLENQLENSLKTILNNVERHVHAMIQVCHLKGFAIPLMSSIELMQMLTQQSNDLSNPLLQIPNHSQLNFSQFKVHNIYDVMEMEDEDRDTMLKPLNENQVSAVADFVNKYPNIELECHWKEDNDGFKVSVFLERDDEDESWKIPISKGYFSKFEHWWLLVADGSQIHYCNEIEMGLKVKLQIDVKSLGKVYLLCDSYYGCDQEQKLK
eukprot:NODE_232_length_12051_cov_1.040997.p1 type:complete len:1780 gc:universal NODE_232_length_12051_cov_1.040997:10578-5239(-)